MRQWPGGPCERHALFLLAAALFAAYWLRRRRMSAAVLDTPAGRIRLAGDAELEKWRRYYDRQAGDS